MSRVNLCLDAHRRLSLGQIRQIYIAHTQETGFVSPAAWEWVAATQKPRPTHLVDRYQQPRQGSAYPPHLPPQKFKVANVTVSVQFAVHHNLDGIFLHLGTELGRDGSGGVHGGAGVDLYEPGLEVSPQDEVGPIELEAVLTGFYVVLSHPHGIGDGFFHRWIDDGAPCCPSTPLLQVLLEAGAGPHVMAREQRAALLVILEAPLNGVVAQVDGAVGNVLVRLVYANNHNTEPALSAQLALTSLCLVQGCCRRCGLVVFGLLALLPRSSHEPLNQPGGTAQTVPRQNRSPPMQNQPLGKIIGLSLSFPRGTCQ